MLSRGETDPTEKLRGEHRAPARRRDTAGIAGRETAPSTVKLAYTGAAVRGPELAQDMDAADA
jgi:hypothetical protein